MAEKKAFDLAVLLGGVSVPAAEQIELLPWAKLIPDERNFYSLVGLEELADSIATVGLLDPIRVRPDGDAYVVISGHRRRAAIKLLLDSGDERFKAGVPCIVERAEISAELAELKLIFANSATRKMTSAEMSRQAARVEELLYALKGQGFAFPGRMQKHVAQACGTTESKLKRLHAIRANLDPALLEMFDAGRLNEEAAYRLQQLPQDVQAYLGQQKAIQNNGVAGDRAKELTESVKKYTEPKCKCPDGSACSHTLPRFKQAALTTMCWATCRGKCCLTCDVSPSYCSYRCPQARKKLEEEKAAKKAGQDEETRREAKRLEAQRVRLTGEFAEILKLAEAQGLRDDENLPLDYCYSVKDLRARAKGEGFSPWVLRKENHPITANTRVSQVVDAARLLDVSVEELIRIGSAGTIKVPETEAEAAAEPAAPPEPGWQTGKPERAGRYFVTILIRAERRGDSVSEHRAEWDGACWWLYNQKLIEGYEVVGWWPLPTKLSEEAIEG